MSATYPLPNVDQSILTYLGPIIQAMGAGQQGNWQREQQILKNQRKAEAKRNQREAANQQAQATALQQQQQVQQQQQQFQSGLQAATGGSAPISMNAQRTAAASATTTPMAQPVVQLPTMQSTSMVGQTQYQRPFTYVPDMSRLTFGGS